MRSQGVRSAKSNVPDILMLCPSDGRRQIVFYQSGVGSEAGFNGQPDPTTILLRKCRYEIGKGHN